MLVINCAIFLTIFAATSASISLYIENKVSEEEYTLITVQREANFIHNFKSQLPVIHRSLDSTKMFDDFIRRFHQFIRGMDISDKILSEREEYFYRAHALLSGYEDLFVLSSTFKDYAEMIKEYEKGEYKDELYKKYLKLEQELYEYEKKYKEFKTETKYLEQYQVFTEDFLINEKRLYKYEKYSTNW